MKYTMIMTSAITVAASLFALFSVVMAAPVAIQPTLLARDEWNPPVEVPNQYSFWKINNTYNVIWYAIHSPTFKTCSIKYGTSFYHRDTSSAPVNITNSIGRIVLYHNGSFVQGPGGLGMSNQMKISTLNWYKCFASDEPLAANFSVRNGEQPITIPDVKPGVYSIVCA